VSVKVRGLAARTSCGAVSLLWAVSRPPHLSDKEVGDVQSPIDGSVGRSGDSLQLDGTTHCSLPTHHYPLPSLT
jgi:hypothetical protein